MNTVSDIERAIREKARREYYARMSKTFSLPLTELRVTAAEKIAGVLDEAWQDGAHIAEEKAVQDFIASFRVCYSPLPWPPRMVNLDEHGKVTEGAHVAVLLPDYGLVFDARPPVLVSSWQEGGSFAGAVELHGRTDWRLPESHELMLLIRHDRVNPAIDGGHFPYTPTDGPYLTATKAVSYPTEKWFVDFSSGWVSAVPMGATYVRAVRSV